MIDPSINPNIDRIALRLKTIPESPGVYQHLDAQGKVIYVGKARNLQRRVASYFSHYDDKSAKIKMLVRNIADTRVTVVASETDALLLENSLIKRYQPRYNSMLKDDKTYPYLCITDEPYPRLLYTRRHTEKGQYYGPYPDGRILRQLQDIIRQLFQYRTCNQMGKRPCIKHQIGLCGAPCAGKQSPQDYQATFDNIRRILRGDFPEILDDLKQRMYAAADLQRFEEADMWKRRIHLLEEYQGRSTIVDTNVRDLDVVSILSDSTLAWVNMMRVKHGAVIYSVNHEVRKQLDESDAELLSTLIPTLHQQSQSTAAEVVVSLPVPDLPHDYLHQTTNPKGDRRKLLELSLRNVESFRKQCLHQRALTQGDTAPHALKLLERLQRALHLPTLPMEIECFDNSNIQGAYPVAGMVRFSAGKPNRNQYRKFNIRGDSHLSPLTFHLNDDYASMAQVVERRYTRLRLEGKPLPDLLIVDGGEGQMHAVRDVLLRIQIPIPIAGLAKDDHHRTSQLLVFSDQRSVFSDATQSSGSQLNTKHLTLNTINVVQLKPTDPLFHLLEQIQNEVHRFAISFHKDKRSKATFRTSLTDIPGIGQKTAHQLLLRFGSVKQVALQTLPDLAAAIGPAKARLVHQALNNN